MYRGSGKFAESGESSTTFNLLVLVNLTVVKNWKAYCVGILGKPLGTISAVQMDFCHEGGGGLKTLSKWFGAVI